MRSNSRVDYPTELPAYRRPTLTFKTLLIAVAAAAAFIAAALIAVPAAQEALLSCLDFARCLGF